MILVYSGDIATLFILKFLKPALGAGGRKFESCYPDLKINHLH